MFNKKIISLSLVALLSGMVLSGCGMVDSGTEASAATEKTQVNMIFANVVCSFAVCSIAFAFVMLGFGYSTDKIIIGNIMLLIPGVALTNSIRDMISGDIMAGMLRFCEACLVSLAIAAGYIIAALIFGGIGK